MDATQETTSASRRRMLLALPVPIIAALVVGWLTAAATPASPPGFDARAAVHINPQTVADPVRRVNGNVPSDVLDAMSDPALRKDVAKALGLASVSSDQVAITPRLLTNGDVLDVTATASTSAGADALASTYANLGAARLQLASSERLKAAIALLDKQQSDLAATQAELARAAARLALTDPARSSANEQLATVDRQRTQLTADRNTLLSTSAILGPSARATSTLEVTEVHAVSPKLLRGALAGAATFLPVALILLGFAAFRRRVPLLRAGAELTGLPVLGVIPRRKQDTARPDDKELAAVDRVVSEVLLEQRRTGSTVLAVTAPGRRSGTSTTAASLAAGLARRGLNVLLVDTDVRNPSQHLLHGLPLQPGLADRLRGDTAEPRLTTDGVHVLTAGTSSTPADLLGHRSLVALLQQARITYDAVIVDVGSLGHPEARLVAALADRVLLCAVPGHTSARELDNCLAAMTSTSILGVVLVRTGRLQRRNHLLATHGSVDLASTPTAAPQAGARVPAPAPAATWPNNGHDRAKANAQDELQSAQGRS